MNLKDPDLYIRMPDPHTGKIMVVHYHRLPQLPRSPILSSKVDRIPRPRRLCEPAQEGGGFRSI